MWECCVACVVLRVMRCVCCVDWICREVCLGVMDPGGPQESARVPWWFAVRVHACVDPSGSQESYGFLVGSVWGSTQFNRLCKLHVCPCFFCVVLHFFLIFRFWLRVWAQTSANHDCRACSLLQAIFLWQPFLEQATAVEWEVMNDPVVLSGSWNRFSQS